MRVRISSVFQTEGFRRLIIDFRVHASRFVEAHNISRASYLACRSTCKRPVRPLRAYTRGRVEPRAKRRFESAKLAWVAFNERDSIVSVSLSLRFFPSCYFHSNCRSDANSYSSDSQWTDDRKIVLASSRLSIRFQKVITFCINIPVRIISTRWISTTNITI